jgi:hypothetical protein
MSAHSHMPPTELTGTKSEKGEQVEKKGGKRRHPQRRAGGQQKGRGEEGTLLTRLRSEAWEPSNTKIWRRKSKSLRGFGRLSQWMAAGSKLSSYEQFTAKFSAEECSYTVCQAHGSIFLRQLARHPSTRWFVTDKNFPRSV